MMALPQHSNFLKPLLDTRHARLQARHDGRVVEAALQGCSGYVHCFLAHDATIVQDVGVDDCSILLQRSIENVVDRPKEAGGPRVFHPAQVDALAF